MRVWCRMASVSGGGFGGRSGRGAGRLWRGGGGLRRRCGDARLHVVGIDNSLGDVGGLVRVEDDGSFLLASIEYQRLALLLCVVNQKRADLGGDAAVGVLHLLLEVVLGFLGSALQLL